MRRRTRLGALLGVVLLSSWASGAAAPAAAPRTIWDGVYTEAQAERGALVFVGVCSRCHSRSEWSHESFLRTRSGRTLEDLFARLYETMPPRGPLPLEEYAEVIAYMLSLQGVPAGERELGTTQEELRAIFIQPAPGE